MSESRIKQRSYLFSAAQAGLGALQSAVILIAVSRTRDLEEAGVITIAFAIANLMMIIARYGIHNFQVTDINQKYQFGDYFFSRIITVAGSSLLTVVFLMVMVFTNRYSPYKANIILEAVLLKQIDAFEDVYTARLQQEGRLDIGAGIASLRLLISTSIIFAAVWFVSIPISLLLGIISSVLVDIFLLSRSRKITDYSKKTWNRERIRSLMKTGVILCIGAALHYYAGNTPKYMVDLFMDDRTQAISGYIMMPIFVITIFNMFMVQPLVKSFGEAWNSGDRKRLQQMTIRHVIMIASVTVLMVFFGIWMGLPILSGIYQVELGDYQREFVILMIGGGIYTLSSLFLVLLTAVRKQKVIVQGCVVCVIIYLISGRAIAEQAGLYGLCLLYVAASLAMLCIFILGMHKTRKTEG